MELSKVKRKRRKHKKTRTTTRNWKRKKKKDEKRIWKGVLQQAVPRNKNRISFSFFLFAFFFDFLQKLLLISCFRKMANRQWTWNQNDWSCFRSSRRRSPIWFRRSNDERWIYGILVFILFTTKRSRFCLSLGQIKQDNMCFLFGKEIFLLKNIALFLSKFFFLLLLDFFVSSFTLCPVASSVERGWPRGIQQKGQRSLMAEQEAQQEVSMVLENEVVAEPAFHLIGSIHHRTLADPPHCCLQCDFPIQTYGRLVQLLIFFPVIFHSLRSVRHLAIIFSV